MRPDCRVRFILNIFLQHALPDSLRLEDKLYGVTQSAFTSGMRCNVMGFALDFGTGIFDGDGDAGRAHCRQIDNVVPDEGGLLGLQSGLGGGSEKAAALVIDALVYEIEFEIAGAQGDIFGNAFRDESCLETADASERDGNAVVGMKGFELDFAGIIRDGRRGQKVEFAVGQDAVDVEKKKFNAAGASLRRDLRHGGNFIIHHIRTIKDDVECAI